MQRCLSLKWIDINKIRLWGINYVFMIIFWGGSLEKAIHQIHYSI